MSAKYGKIAATYKNVEKEAIVETEDPHKLVLMMFDGLIKAMNIYIDNIDIKTADIELRSKNFSKSLTIIYALQSSLDFEKGGEIANNLFQTYEFARQMLIGSINNMNAVGPTRAVGLLSQIREAWADMGSQLKNDQ
jgi:flagellar protein FliS